MREVIEAIDGPIRLNLCLNSGRSCPRRPTCPAHPVWAEAQEAMLRVLDSASVREMAKTAAQTASGQAAVLGSGQECEAADCVHETAEVQIP
jgi:DNA-binding IscR family transcriptional regulator